MKQLPRTGTAGLLERLSAHVPDDLINTLFSQRSGPGRRGLFSAAQLFRVNLLALLTPAHSFNLLVELLAEHRSWRSFARLRNRLCVPDVRMLNEFRHRLDLTKLRQVNEYLLRPLMEGTTVLPKTVALIDSTDLPAATNAYKKIRSASTALNGRWSVPVAARTGKVVTSSDTKNTHCACGYTSIVPKCCWPR